MEFFHTAFHHPNVGLLMISTNTCCIKDEINGEDSHCRFELKIELKRNNDVCDLAPNSVTTKLCRHPQSHEWLLWFLMRLEYNRCTPLVDHARWEDMRGCHLVKPSHYIVELIAGDAHHQSTPTNIAHLPHAGPTITGVSSIRHVISTDIDEKTYTS